MNIVLNKNEFLKSLSKIDNIISTREIKTVLSNVLIEAKETEIILTASDFELTISTNLTGNILNTGSIAIPAKKLNEVIGELITDEVVLKVEDENKISIAGNSSKSKARFSIMGESATDFPTIRSIAEESYKEIPIELIRKMFKYTRNSMTKDDARYVFNGTYMKFENDKLTCVTTDGRRLSLIHENISIDLETKEEIILPYKTVNELIKLLEKCEKMSIAYDNSDQRFYFKTENTVLSSKIIDGSFPDYNQVIPDNIKQKITINKNDFENSIRQVAVMGVDPTRKISLDFNSNSLVVSSSTPDFGEAEDILPIKYEGEAIKIAFNSYYIRDVLKIIEDETIIIGISSSSSPMLIEEEKYKNFIAIIMPMNA